jgi:hypothetical protein
MPIEQDAIGEVGQQPTDDPAHDRRRPDIGQRPHDWRPRKLPGDGTLQVRTIAVDEADPSLPDQPRQHRNVSYEPKWVPEPMARASEPPQAHHPVLERRNSGRSKSGCRTPGLHGQDHDWLISSRGQRYLQLHDLVVGTAEGRTGHDVEAVDLHLAHPILIGWQRATNDGDDWTVNGDHDTESR